MAAALGWSAAFAPWAYHPLLFLLFPLGSILILLSLYLVLSQVLKGWVAWKRGGAALVAFLTLGGTALLFQGRWDGWLTLGPMFPLVLPMWPTLLFLTPGGDPSFDPGFLRLFATFALLGVAAFFVGAGLVLRSKGEGLVREKT